MEKEFLTSVEDDLLIWRTQKWIERGWTVVVMYTAPLVAFRSAVTLSTTGNRTPH